MLRIVYASFRFAFVSTFRFQMLGSVRICELQTKRLGEQHIYLAIGPIVGWQIL